MNEIPKWVRFIIFLVVFIAGTTIAVFKTFATNSELEKLKLNQVHYVNILCGMAIDFKWPKASEACKKVVK